MPKMASKKERTVSQQRVTDDHMLKPPQTAVTTTNKQTNKQTARERDGKHQTANMRSSAFGMTCCLGGTGPQSSQKGESMMESQVIAPTQPHSSLGVHVQKCGHRQSSNYQSPWSVALHCCCTVSKNYWTSAPPLLAPARLCRSQCSRRHPRNYLA